MWLTCVTMVFGSVWFILSVTTEISIGSPGRRGGRSSWSETCRVWPMTTATLRAGGFWEATGIIIWENRSNIQPATPIIPWKRRTHCWSLMQTQEVKLPERRQYTVHFLHRSPVLCHLDQHTHQWCKDLQRQVCCSVCLYHEDRQRRHLQQCKIQTLCNYLKKWVSLDWISLVKLKGKKIIAKQMKGAAPVLPYRGTFLPFIFNFILCYSSNWA